MEPFADAYPERFFNVGVAEQNMVGLATGLAEAGFIPFVYSIVPFAVLRPYEFIRNGPIQHRLPVRIVGVGGGMEYGPNGLSHYGLEDIAVMRAQPGITVIAPADHQQTRRPCRQPGTCPARSITGSARTTRPWCRDWRDVSSWGNSSASRGNRSGADCDGQLWPPKRPPPPRSWPPAVSLAAWLIVASVSPAPVDDLAGLLARLPVALTVEAHYRVGGVGSLVAEVIAERDLRCRLVRCGVGSSARRHYRQPALPLSALWAISGEAGRDGDGGRCGGPSHDPASARKLSAIIACYRDAPAVPIMHERLTAVFKKIGVDYEIIFVNDNSPDNAREVLAALAARDPRVVVINHSRNFGSQSAFTSGMRIATGDAVILLDGDLQDPPELIESFYQKWLEGYDVVYGERVQREATWFLQVAYKAFYRLFRTASYVPIPLDAGDFSLIDRRVVDALNSLPENNRFLRGLRAWVGYRQTGVPYVRPERMFGRTTNSLLRNLGWARKAILSFSYAPLDFITWLALATVGFSFLAIVLQVSRSHLLPGPGAARVYDLVRLLPLPGRHPVALPGHHRVLSGPHL